MGAVAAQVTIGIPASRATTVRPAVQSVRRQTVDDIEVIVCGQGRNDAELREVVKSDAGEDDRVRYVHSVVTGCSAARNVILETSRAEFVAFLDDDCEAAPDWIEVLIDRFRRYPQVGLVGGAVVAPPRPKTLRPARCPNWMPEEVLYDPEIGFELPAMVPFIGANFAVRRLQVSALGGFDELLGAGGPFRGAEDSDYGFRVNDAEIAFATTPDAVVHHTYGYRVGFRSRLRSLAAYAMGSGALARKRALVDVEESDRWYASMQQLCLRDWSMLRPDRLVIARLRWHYFLKGFEGYGLHIEGAS